MSKSVHSKNEILRSNTGLIINPSKAYPRSETRDKLTGLTIFQGGLFRQSQAIKNRFPSRATGTPRLEEHMLIVFCMLLVPSVQVKHQGSDQSPRLSVSIPSRSSFKVQVKVNGFRSRSTVSVSIPSRSSFKAHVKVHGFSIHSIQVKLQSPRQSPRFQYPFHPGKASMFRSPSYGYSFQPSRSSVKVPISRQWCSAIDVRRQGSDRPSMCPVIHVKRQGPDRPSMVIVIQDKHHGSDLPAMFKSPAIQDKHQGSDLPAMAIVIQVKHQGSNLPATRSVIEVECQGSDLPAMCSVIQVKHLGSDRQSMYPAIQVKHQDSDRPCMCSAIQVKHQGFDRQPMYSAIHVKRQGSDRPSMVIIVQVKHQGYDLPAMYPAIQVKHQVSDLPAMSPAIQVELQGADLPLYGYSVESIKIMLHGSGFKVYMTIVFTLQAKQQESKLKFGLQSKPAIMDPISVQCYSVLAVKGNEQEPVPLLSMPMIPNPSPIQSDRATIKDPISIQYDSVFTAQVEEQGFLLHPRLQQAFNAQLYIKGRSLLAEKANNQDATLLLGC
ncbi:hypothetical protein F4703DRAFT_1936981 [Phycomyces blakesleeanus]